jgi:hypothetical protein
VILVEPSRDRISVASVAGIFLGATGRTMCPGVDSASKNVVPNVKYSGALTYPDPLGHLDGLLWVTVTFYLFLLESDLTPGP